MVSQHRLKWAIFRREIRFRLEAPTNKETGVNFVLFSRHATGVRLEFYQNPDDSSPTQDH